MTVKDLAGVPIGADEWGILERPQGSVTVLAAYVTALVAQRQEVTIEVAGMVVMAMHPLELMACYQTGPED